MIKKQKGTGNDSHILHNQKQRQVNCEREEDERERLVNRLIGKKIGDR